MFRIEDGREQFYQWDSERRLIIEDSSITEVHYCNKTDDCSLVTEVYEENGTYYSNVPNILLQTDWAIRVYAYDKFYTKHSETFKVNARTKPADYAYTETEVMNWETMHSKVDALVAEVEEAEQIRQDNELIRCDNEIARTDAEAERIEAEIEREENAFIVITAANQATERAQEAADYATNSASGVVAATDSANAAATLATNAATNANAAAGVANGAAERAENATNAANEATDKAILATDNAVKATEDTIVATTGANEAAERAENATQEAQEATTKANNAASGINDKFANALKGSKSGEGVGITDISPIEHNMGVSVRKKNLFDMNLATTQEQNGITLTVNEDKSITINGKATAITYFKLGEQEYKAGDYYLSGCSGGSSSTYLLFWQTTTDSNMSPCYNGSVHRNLATDETRRVIVGVYKDVTVNNVVLYPMVTKEATTSYAPYIEDISTVKLMKQGKNLISNTYYTPSGTVSNGITYTISDDGGIVANGTASGLSQFTFKSKNSLELSAGTYSYSDGAVGIASTYFSRMYFKAVNSNNTYTFQTTSQQTITLTEDVILGYANIYVYSGVTVQNLIFKPMLELSNAPTEYEPYIEPTVYDVQADGSVEGVKSLYPNTTLYTDTGGAVIDTEYNRDINKAFAELQNALISLGGNV